MRTYGYENLSNKVIGNYAVKKTDPGNILTRILYK